MDFKLLFIGNLIRKNILESHCDVSSLAATEGVVEILQCCTCTCCRYDVTAKRDEQIAVCTSR
jgi:hypothetical protein